MQINMKKNKTKKLLVLLDSHALIHRAFHALPPLTSSKGEPVGAVYGVANVLLKIVKDMKPDYIAAAFDRPEPTFRHDAYEDYKAQRAAAPDALIPQFDRTKDLMRAFNIPVYEKAGFEADDVLGTLVEEAKKEDNQLRVLIASGDMDTIQLVEGDRVCVFTMRKGIADTVLYNEAASKERFGFNPEYVPDFKGLKGDPSDNIKGVPGIGDKTATVLIQTFGSLEKLYKNLEGEAPDPAAFKGRIGELLRTHKKDAFFSRDLAIIRKDVPIKFNLEECAWSGFNRDKAADFLRELNFTSLLNRLASVSPTPVDKKNTKKKAEEAQAALALDETSTDMARTTLSDDFFKQAERAGEVAWRMQESGALLEAAVKKDVWSIDTVTAVASKEVFLHLFRNKKIFHAAFGAKEVLKFLWNAGVDTARMDTDACIAAWVLEPTLREPDLGDLIQQKLRIQLEEHPLVYLVPVWKELKKELKRDKLEHVYTDIEMPLIPILAEMERTGIALDASVLEVFSKELEKRIYEREKKIYKLAGSEFNINSPKQLGDILFDTLDIAPEGVRKTDGGARSTRASELTKLRGVHPVVDEILAYREETKLKSTYVDALPLLRNATTHRIHATFKQTGTVTGRVSSQDPNLQNIPIRTTLGQEIRRAFVASAGFELVSFDYSQIELRLAASLANDTKMIQAFLEGGDIHTLTAAAVNHVLPEQVTPEMRRAAKTINFGILYGMGSVSLAEGISVTRREAEAFIKEYFNQFPGVKKYMESLKEHAVDNGYVETLFGRRRYFKNISSMGWQARREAERMAINAPIQGSEADIVKMAMIRIDTELREYIKDDVVRLLIQVHDELLFEIQKDFADKLAPLIQKIMSEVCTLRVPLNVDIKRGLNWLEMEKIVL